MSKSVDMGMLTIPESGLTLVGPSGSNAADTSGKTAGPPVQVMRLDLPPDVLKDLLRSCVSDKKRIHIAFGRTVVSRSIMSIMQLTANRSSCKDTVLRQ